MVRTLTERPRRARSVPNPVHLWSLEHQRPNVIGTYRTRMPVTLSAGTYAMDIVGNPHPVWSLAVIAVSGTTCKYMKNKQSRRITFDGPVTCHRSTGEKQYQLTSCQRRCGKTSRIMESSSDAATSSNCMDWLGSPTFFRASDPNEVRFSRSEPFE